MTQPPSGPPPEEPRGGRPDPQQPADPNAPGGPAGPPDDAAADPYGGPERPQDPGPDPASPDDAGLPRGDAAGRPDDTGLPQGDTAGPPDDAGLPQGDAAGRGAERPRPRGAHARPEPEEPPDARDPRTPFESPGAGPVYGEPSAPQEPGAHGAGAAPEGGPSPAAGGPWYPADGPTEPTGPRGPAGPGDPGSPGGAAAPGPGVPPGGAAGAPAGSAAGVPGSHQPYGSPEGAAQPPDPYGIDPNAAAYGPGGIRLAEWWQRLLARIIDGFVVLIPAIVLLFVEVLLTVALLGPRSVGAASPYGDRPGESFAADVISGLLLLALLVAYEAWMLSRWGRTVGKMALGLRVVPVESPGSAGPGLPGKTSFVRAFVWWGPNGLGWLPVIGGYLWIFPVINGLWPLWDRPYRQSLNDKIARTLVITDR